MMQHLGFWFWFISLSLPLFSCCYVRKCYIKGCKLLDNLLTACCPRLHVQMQKTQQNKTMNHTQILAFIVQGTC